MIDQIKGTLPDGSIREYQQGSSAMDVALSISEGLARNVLAAEVNGEVWDASRALPAMTNLKLLTWNDEDGEATFGTHQLTLWQKHLKLYIQELS